jgi:hypothetical protein
VLGCSMAASPFVQDKFDCPQPVAEIKERRASRGYHPNVLTTTGTPVAAGGVVSGKRESEVAHVSRQSRGGR